MELLNLLRSQHSKKAVGTLLLGESTDFRELFFEQDTVYLCGSRYSGRVDIDGLVETRILGEKISPEDLDHLIGSTDLKAHLVPRLLLDQTIIEQEEFDALLHSQLRYEILDLFFANRSSFHFQEGRVPEELLSVDGASQAIELDGLVEALEAQQTEAQQRAGLLGGSDEIFVQTAEGMSYLMTHRDDYGLRAIFNLVDGFRALDDLVKNAPFFEFYTARRLAEALENELLKKTVLPELRGLEPEFLDEEECRQHLPTFRLAVKYAVDTLKYREQLARVHEKLHDYEDAVVQYNFIGDAYFRMHKVAKAVSYFQCALELCPDDVLITDKIIHIYQDAAEERVAAGDWAAGLEFLESAQAIRPEDLRVYSRMVELLLEHDEGERLADLCDRTVARAKRRDELALAETACQTIIEAAPENTLYQKKLANVYLDFDRPGEAAEELAVLARLYQRDGNRERAIDLAEKIHRMRGGGNEVARVYRTLSRELGIARKERSWGLATGLGIGLLLLVALYQGVAWKSWNEIREEFGLNGPREAFALAEASEEATEQRKERLLLLSHRLETFTERYPLSLLRAHAGALAMKTRRQANALEVEHKQHQEGRLERARRAFDMGLIEMAQRELAGIPDLAADNPLALEISRLSAKVEADRQSAEALLERARDAEAAGRWRDALSLYRQLIEGFPKSDLHEDLLLPLVVDSNPEVGLLFHVRSANDLRPLGQTPTVLRLPPGGSAVVELRSDGCYPGRFELRADEDVPTLLLDRRATSASLPIAPDRLPPLDGETLFLRDNAGRLVEYDFVAGKILWKLERETINAVVGDPTRCQEGVYSAWNDRKVQLHDTKSLSGGSPRLRAWEDLPDLARTGVVVLGDQLVAVGTKRDRVRLFTRTELEESGAVVVEGTPEHLVAMGASRLLVTTDRGLLFLAEVPSGRIVWKREVGREPRQPPELLGGALLLETADSVIVSLDPMSGESQSRLPLRSGESAAFDPGSAKVFLLDVAGKLARLDPGSLRVELVAPEARAGSRLLDLGERVAIHDPDEGRLVLFDSLTLRPGWSARTATGTTILEARESAGHILARVQRRDGRQSFERFVIDSGARP